jgi:uncharacterized membrane protein YcaP (DUF421 family)
MDPLEVFEPGRFFMNNHPWEFLLEVVVRTAVMFILILTVLAISGKRSLKQLSVFELVIVIGLGSAAGDPMFYEDVGIIPAAVVLLVVIALYRFVIFLANKFKPVEHLLEGKTICLIYEGEFSIKNFKNENLAQDEFFTELRLKGISQLGQIRLAYIETTGDISVFFYADDDVKPGLPILPELYEKQIKTALADGLYACTFCGHVEQIHASHIMLCPKCKYEERTWTKACVEIRVK